MNIIPLGLNQYLWLAELYIFYLFKVEIGSVINISCNGNDAIFKVFSFKHPLHLDHTFAIISDSTTIEFIQPTELHTVKFLKALSKTPFVGFDILQSNLKDEITHRLRESLAYEKFSCTKAGGILISGQFGSGKRSLIM
jgi:hypothetical protein